ncbi:hypothetical protein LshimejAT787_1204070 [Lyophyllum shimeji]|uniref:Endonuclease/exonuclease/phosphatase domain-containing protein n=1 Tax=Lyophyllum shimeji TaxID=47721 RepID=A0A9P3PVV0_LYOSH|nr:hypothetical protein LshimejAT787_1204070 [Lyophyllum shimeji]
MWESVDNCHLNSSPDDIQPLLDLRLVMTDHLPVITEVELPLARTSSPPSKDFLAADWEAFNDALKEKLSTHPPACCITSKEEFDARVDLLCL